MGRLWIFKERLALTNVTPWLAGCSEFSAGNWSNANCSSRRSARSMILPRTAATSGSGASIVDSWLPLLISGASISVVLIVAARSSSGCSSGTRSLSSFTSSSSSGPESVRRLLLARGDNDSSSSSWVGFSGIVTIRKRNVSHCSCKADIRHASGPDMRRKVNDNQDDVSKASDDKGKKTRTILLHGESWGHLVIHCNPKPLVFTIRP